LLNIGPAKGLKFPEITKFLDAKQCFTLLALECFIPILFLY